MISKVRAGLPQGVRDGLLGRHGTAGGPGSLERRLVQSATGSCQAALPRCVLCRQGRCSYGFPQCFSGCQEADRRTRGGVPGQIAAGGDGQARGGRGEREKRWLPPEGLTPEEVRAVIAAAATERDRLLLRTLWATGGRVSEVLALRAQDVRRDALVLPNLKNPSQPLRLRAQHTPAASRLPIPSEAAATPSSPSVARRHAQGAGRLPGHLTSAQTPPRRIGERPRSPIRRMAHLRAIPTRTAPLSSRS